MREGWALAGGAVLAAPLAGSAFVWVDWRVGACAAAVWLLCSVCSASAWRSHREVRRQERELESLRWAARRLESVMPGNVRVVIDPQIPEHHAALVQVLEPLDGDRFARMMDEIDPSLIGMPHEWMDNELEARP